jgi:hypothetical protein
MQGFMSERIDIKDRHQGCIQDINRKTDMKQKGRIKNESYPFDFSNIHILYIYRYIIFREISNFQIGFFLSILNTIFTI